jgi:hypothetical protein
MKNLIFRIIATFAILIGVFKPELGKAEMPSQLPSMPNFEVLEAVDNQILDDMRGGFMTATGVRLDIGVEKASYVDGVLQVQNAFRMDDVAVLGKGHGGGVSANDLQNISSALNTVIQNNLDQKTIQNFTVIDVNVRNFANFHNGFVDSIRGLQDLQVVR